MLNVKQTILLCCETSPRSYRPLFFTTTVRKQPLFHGRLAEKPTQSGRQRGRKHGGSRSFGINRISEQVWDHNTADHLSKCLRQRHLKQVQNCRAPKPDRDQLNGPDGPPSRSHKTALICNPYLSSLPPLRQHTSTPSPLAVPLR